MNDKDSVTPAQAIEIAKESIIGKMQLKEDFLVAVEQDAKTFIVTFTNNTTSPGYRGPDYIARVVIDIQSATVIEVLVGS